MSGGGVYWYTSTERARRMPSGSVHRPSQEQNQLVQYEVLLNNHNYAVNSEDV
jgi:hypothetical protein